MNIVHLTASTLYGGPERQMLGLARHLPIDRSVFLSFAEGGRCQPFIDIVRHDGLEALALENDTPHAWRAVAEIAVHLERVRADVLCCHGYKADILGRLAARRHPIPVVAVSRGWTGENFKVRLYEKLDRLHLRYMDHVVCVAEAQAVKVRRTGVKPERMRVIRNSVDAGRFAAANARSRAELQSLFPLERRRIVGAAGRLSPEKGFDVFVAAAARVARTDSSVGFVLFGEGACRAALTRQIEAAGLSKNFVLTGFRGDLDCLVPSLDLFVLSSHTEGLPNVVLEACAAGVPVAATAVGGTPEVIEDGVSGYLVPPANPAALAERIHDALAVEERRRALAERGRRRVLDQFGFARQAESYRELFAELTTRKPPRGAGAGFAEPAACAANW